jgi:hypothetical protein
MLRPAGTSALQSVGASDTLSDVYKIDFGRARSGWGTLPCYSAYATAIS